MLNVPDADAYSDYAVITWQPQYNCLVFNVYVALSATLSVPLNNGEGLGLTSPAITADNVSFFYFFIKNKQKNKKTNKQKTNKQTRFLFLLASSNQ